MMMRQKDDMAAAFLNWKDAEAYIELQFFFSFVLDCKCLKKKAYSLEYFAYLTNTLTQSCSMHFDRYM